MKNITLAAEEDALYAARVYAAERKTTVNPLVRGHLAQATPQRTKAREAMARLRRVSEQTDADLGPGYRFDRERPYDR